MPARSIRRPRVAVVVSLVAWAAVSGGNGARAQNSEPEFLRFVRSQAASLRSGDKPPPTAEEWSARRSDIRRRLLATWGGFPDQACALNPRKLGEIRREGCTVERLVFQTRPGVQMTANVYVPVTPGKHPAILHVHGHWKGAKQDPVVQARAAGSARLGFVAMVVDAFGAGERGVGKALGEYHGEMTGATLLPVGLPLSGLQVYENLRAVDYLRTRPDVDPDHIGITGASGGGNQTMYALGWDERLAAGVPVCSVGNYHAYLGAACCVCELVPGALTFTDEWGVLGLAAPRALMVVNATRDAPQFSVAAARASLDRLEPLYRLLGRPEAVRHAVFESAHDYNQAMREAMYGWMTLHLKNEGNGSPVREPAFQPEDPESLRCFPGESRPDDFVTIPRFALAEARRLQAARTVPDARDKVVAWQEQKQTALINRVLGGLPQTAGLPAPDVSKAPDGTITVTFRPEAGLTLQASVAPASRDDAPLAVLLHLDGAKAARQTEVAKELTGKGWRVATMDLRATGQLAVPNDRIGQAAGHNSAEWAAWIGRPLLGQWTVDVRRLLDSLGADKPLPARVAVVGLGGAGLVALTAAATDPRITHAATVGTLASYATEGPYRGQHLGVMAPGILREVGDVAELAALSAPRRVVLAGGVSGVGGELEADALRAAYQPASRVWGVLGAPETFRLLERDEPAAVVRAFD